MADFIKVAAAGAKQSLSTQSIEIRHSVLIEVVAALLGYHTFAALNAEELDQSLDRHLDDAQVLILNEKLGLKRSTQLCQSAVTVFAECVAALDRSVPILVFLTVEEYCASLGRLAVQAVLATNPTAANLARPKRSAGTIAVGSFRFTDPLWSARTSWTLEADITGRYNEGVDLAESPSAVTLEFQKAGRAGLILKLDGLSWAPPITRRTFLETFRLDALFTMNDGTNYRPTIGMLVNLETRAILGSAISATEREARLDAVRDASVTSFAQQRTSDASRQMPMLNVGIDGGIWRAELYEGVSAEKFLRKSNPFGVPKGSLELVIKRLQRLASMIPAHHGVGNYSSLEEFRFLFAELIKTYNSNVSVEKIPTRSVRSNR
ncbi:hypothetical protein [Pseudomonas viridiflava]|uniref:hypothetical protein n=1 Tax=Pseudomonas viridiflava TaxID=33069 RepID=UPI000F01752F|nr:hypothetical protein [Pseudomonas viridiflava]